MQLTGMPSVDYRMLWAVCRCLSTVTTVCVFPFSIVLNITCYQGHLQRRSTIIVPRACENVPSRPPLRVHHAQHLFHVRRNHEALPKSLSVRLPLLIGRKPQVIREDFTIEAYDILELHCELVANRMRLVASQKVVPPDMEQAVCTIIWAADRAEVRWVAFQNSQTTNSAALSLALTSYVEPGCGVLAVAVAAWPSKAMLLLCDAVVFYQWRSVLGNLAPHRVTCYVLLTSGI